MARHEDKHGKCDTRDLASDQRRSLIRDLARKGHDAAREAIIVRDLSEHRRGQSEDKHGD